MRARLTAVASLVACLVAAGPAGAATLSADRGCYRESQRMVVTGTGFTPGAPVDVQRDGAPFGTLTANALGNVRGIGRAPVIDPSRQRRFSLVARDRANPALAASVSPLATILEARVESAPGAKTKRRKIVARGFTEGRRLYLHIRRGRSVRTLSLGKLGRCGTKSLHKRIFRSSAKVGIYTLQFDSRKRYSRNTVPRVTRLFQIYRIIRFRPSGAGVAASLAREPLG